MKPGLCVNVGERKSEIENLLAYELNKVKHIRENIQRSSEITSGVVNILSSFEDRLARLEDTILPVYNKTGNLQRQQQNIEKVLVALEHVMGYYCVAEEEDAKIRAGPASGRLDSFLVAMHRLKAARNYFDKNNPQSVELDNVSSLFNLGNKSLLAEFKELLLKHSRPIPPVQLLDLIANDEDVSGDDVSIGSVSTLGGEAVVSELGTMASWLLNENKLEVVQIYATARSQAMLRSINMLKEHHKQASKGNSVSPSMSMRLAKYPSKLEGSSRKRLQAALEKRANKMLLKASQTLENSGFTMSRRSTIHIEKGEDLLEESEMDAYLVCVMAVQRLMQAERNLMAGVIPSAHQNPVFQNIIQDSLAVIVQDGENIAERAKKCIAKHDFGSALVIFPILKNLGQMRPEFDRAVLGCDYNIRSQLTNILNILHATGGKLLEEMVESVRGDTSVGLPKDGTVHQVTSNTLVLLDQLTHYSETVSTVLEISSSGGAAAASPTDNQLLLAIYIRKVLSELNCTLVSKSEGYSDAGVRALFRLNNCHHVLKALQRSGLLNLLILAESDAQQTYLDMMSTHKAAYQTSWNKLVSYITNTEDIVTIPGRIKDKDRNAIKDRFSGFNKEMEEISRLQRGYSVADVELRESLKRDNKEYILPLYNKFYYQMLNVPFTKNIEKYIKYSPDQVASMIDRFFDVAA